MNKNDVIICLMTFMGIISSLALWEWVLIRYLYPPDSEAMRYGRKAFTYYMKVLRYTIIPIGLAVWYLW